LSVYKKEALAILHALKKWRHYFLSNKVIIKTDQQALKYVANQRLLDGIQQKLMLKLLEFTYEIEYKKGKENRVADALSRKFQEDNKEEDKEKVLSCNQQTLVSMPTSLQEVQNSYAEDEHCLKLMQELVITENNHHNFTLQAGILRYKGKIYIGSTTYLTVWWTLRS
jgi:hypothetical protein